jgi:hypothetical protein
MSDKSTYRPTTALSTVSDPTEPISDEDRKQLDEKWAKRCLDKICRLASENAIIASMLCETAVECARNDPKLFQLIKKTREEKIKKKRGRPPTTLPEWLILLHYAHARLESNHDRGVTIDKLKEYTRSARGVMITDEALETQISKILTAYRKGEIPLPFDDKKFPDWAEGVIQARGKRGDKSRRKINMDGSSPHKI